MNNLLNQELYTYNKCIIRDNDFPNYILIGKNYMNSKEFQFLGDPPIKDEPKSIYEVIAWAQTESDLKLCKCFIEIFQCNDEYDLAERESLRFILGVKYCKVLARKTNNLYPCISSFSYPYDSMIYGMETGEPKIYTLNKDSRSLNIDINSDFGFPQSCSHPDFISNKFQINKFEISEKVWKFAEKFMVKQTNEEVRLREKIIIFDEDEDSDLDDEYNLQNILDKEDDDNALIEYLMMTRYLDPEYYQILISDHCEGSQEIESINCSSNKDQKLKFYKEYYKKHKKDEISQESLEDSKKKYVEKKMKQVDIMQKEFNNLRKEYTEKNLDIALPCSSNRISYLENGIRIYKKKLAKEKTLEKPVIVKDNIYYGDEDEDEDEG
jgi:hypothetical protein